MNWSGRRAGLSAQCLSPKDGRSGLFRFAAGYTESPTPAKDPELGMNGRFPKDDETARLAEDLAT
jgi:hypothetical protein